MPDKLDLSLPPRNARPSGSSAGVVALLVLLALIGTANLVVTLKPSAEPAPGRAKGSL